MAVQAQYPSNVLLLNRSGQEGYKGAVGGHDYSLQQQPLGYFDQSQMFLNNIDSVGTNNNNSRKRGRDAAAAAAGAAVPIGGFFIHPQAPPQLVDHAHPHQCHHTQQSNGVVSTGLRLAFGGQSRQNQHHQQPQLQQHLQPLPQPLQSGLSSLLSDDFATQIKQQRDELDQFLHAQGELLRRTLAEKRQRHYGALLGAAEEAAARRLSERAAEVDRATRRNAELEARAAQLSREAQVWQAKARAQEAAAASLQAQLQQAIVRGGGGSSAEQRMDGGGEGGHQADDAESAYVDPERVANSAGPVCRACRSRVASVVLLPCRHLCVCTECNGVVQACPLCFSARKTSVEVNFP